MTTRRHHAAPAAASGNRGRGHQPVGVHRTPPFMAAPTHVRPRVGPVTATVLKHMSHRASNEKMPLLFAAAAGVGVPRPAGLPTRQSMQSARSSLVIQPGQRRPAGHQMDNTATTAG